MTKEEKVMYDSALKRKWDNQSVLDNAIMTAREDEQARAAEEKQELLLKVVAEKPNTAVKLKLFGVPIANSRRVGVNH